MLRNFARISFVAFLALGFVMPAMAQEEKKAEEKQESADDAPKTFQEISLAIAKKRSALVKKINAEKVTTARQELIQEYYGVANEYADQIIELFGEKPDNRIGASLMMSMLQSQDAKLRGRTVEAMMKAVKADAESDNSFQMLMTLATHRMVSEEVKGEAKSTLMKNFGESEKIADLAMSMTRSPATKANVEMLEGLLEKSSNETVQGAATYALGKLLSASSKEEVKARGVALIKSIPKKFPDVTVYNGRANLAEMVEGEIFELENLQIGMEVPNIKGEDVDGVEFSLHDYKGKVVVIDFWGDW